MTACVRSSPTAGRAPERPRLRVPVTLIEPAPSRPDRRFYVYAVTVDLPRSVISAADAASSARSARSARPRGQITHLEKCLVFRLCRDRGRHLSGLLELWRSGA